MIAMVENGEFFSVLDPQDAYGSGGSGGTRRGDAQRPLFTRERRCAKAHMTGPGGPGPPPVSPAPAAHSRTLTSRRMLDQTLDGPDGAKT